MDTRAPTFLDLGLVVEHDQACAVYCGGDDLKSAVLRRGVFQPSWKAQAEGWALIQAKTRFQRWLLKRFFKIDLDRAAYNARFFSLLPSDPPAKG